MKAKLFSQWGSEKGKEFWIGAEAAIGRGADNDVQLDAKPVSSRHARLFFDAEAGAYFLKDLDSLNGTQIDGTPVARIERLDRLHVLAFGGVCELLFVLTESAPGEAPASIDGTRVDAEPPVLPDALAAEAEAVSGGTQIEESPVVLPEGLAADDTPPTETPAAEPAEDAPAESGVEPPAESGFVLAMIEEDSPRRYALREGENLVGRSRDAQVALASRQLSRRHAVLTVTGDRVTVRDLGSRNHTYLDEREVGAEEIEVAARSRLRFGLVEARLLRHDDEEPVISADAS